MKQKFIPILLLTLIFAFTHLNLFAQQGNLMLYGSLNYQHGNNTGKTFAANPIGVGYFFNNHVVAGINYAFNRKKDVGNILQLKHNEIGLFYSDSKMLGDHFVFIGQVDAHYLWGTTGLNTPAAYNYNGYMFRLYPIVGVLLGHGWALKAKFCELSYQQTTGKDPAKTKNKIFVAGINGSTIGLGVSKNISLHKHSS